jgi:hypothetical protein
MSARASSRAWWLALSSSLVVPGAALASIPNSDAHDESAMFGEPAAAAVADAGAPAAPAAASPGHDEAGMFGDATTPAPTTAAAPTDGGPSGTPGNEHAGAEGAMFGAAAQKSSSEADAVAAAVPFNPLTIGGQLYLRSAVSFYKDHPPSQASVDVPSLLDVYLDARPNDRVRGFVSGRLNYDPSIDPNQLGPFGSPAQSRTNPQLDQLWLNFDIFRTVFVTVGKQHVKWGTGRFWNPTDFLQPQRLDALNNFFDSRTGVDLLKFHLPWEKYNWNLYGIVLLDNGNAVNTIGEIGAAARAEIVLGPAELGLDGKWQKGSKPRYGIDLSTGLGPIPIDVYAEAAFHSPRGEMYYRLKNDELVPSLGLGNFERYSPDSSLTTQLVAGGSYSTDLGDNNALTVGAEYFFNPLGADNAILYPYEILKGAYTPFYAGQHYVGAFVSLVVPTSNAFASNAFALSTIGNLSDLSFTSRLNYSITLLTHLSLETYVAVHYGTEGGEFRFGFDTSKLGLPPGSIPTFQTPTPAVDLGLALRIRI